MDRKAAAGVAERRGVVGVTKYDIPTPRKRKEIPSKLVVAIICALIAGLLVGSLVAGAHGYIPDVTEAEMRPARKITHDSLGPVYTYDGEIIRPYVFVDPDTGLQYLVSDRGGITERWGADGKQMGTPK